MECVALASGSNGNAIWVRTRDAALLFDAGVSGKELQRRAASREVPLDRLDAVVLSHAHGDHVQGAGVVARRLRVPVFASAGTWRLAGRRIGAVDRRATFRAGETLVFGRTRVHTIPTPHDAPGSAAFVVESEGRRVGILTDLGHVFGRLCDVVGGLEGVFLESNYDPGMLHDGPYPYALQDRIAGPGGHLSNEECALVLRSASGNGLRWAALAHLSGNCNTAAKALRTVAPAVAKGVEVCVAPRDRASPRLGGPTS